MLLKRYLREGQVLQSVTGESYITQSGDYLYEEVEVKVKNPGVMDLPEGGFENWSIAKLVTHLDGLSKTKGKPEITKAVLNLERFNKNKNPELSAKAHSVMTKLSDKWDKED
jgi:hypothetical protein